MKKCIVIFSVLFFHSGFTQEKSNYSGERKLGIHLGTVLPSDGAGFDYYLGFIFEKEKHTLDIGPLYGKTSAIDLIPGDGPSYALNGFQCGYEIDPFEKRRTFEFFFFYNFLFHHYKAEVSANPPSDEISTKHLLLFSNTFGSGFRWNISQRLYLKNKIGIGPQISNEFVQFETQENDSSVELDIASTFHFGLGIRF